MNSFTNASGSQRKTSDEREKFYIQDDENTMMYRPSEMHGNRFFGSVSKLLSINDMLNMEVQKKYHWDYEAHWKARLEAGSAPICFNDCIQDVTTGSGLSSDEKNCMRECYLKRITVREDFNMLAQQMKARQTLDRGRFTLV